MNKYHFDPTLLRGMEQSPVPFAVYQFVDRRVVTLVLSSGILRLFGYESREDALEMTENDRYRLIHPDDAVRVAEATYRFATEGGEFNEIYRSRRAAGEDYYIIHARGEHVRTETGARVAYVWYANEGLYEPGEDAAAAESAGYSRLLRQMSADRREHYDALTGLPTIAYFFELADAGVRRMLAEGRQPAVLYADLSGVKNYNSRYGFAEGDKLIKETAFLLKRAFSNENCGRFGQDHFAVYADAEGLEARLARMFEEQKTLNGGKSLPLRVGIYLLSRNHEGTVGAACDWAKMACDEHRQYSDSHFSYFNDAMLAEAKKREYIIENIDRAIEEGWIVVYYQPIVRATNGRVCDEEALARWIDPVRGFMSPGDFIPTLEAAKLIYKLDLCVVDRVLEKLRTQSEAGLFVVPVSVNLSRVDFETCDIVEEIRRRVDAAGVRRDLVTIEITESVVGSNFEFIKTQVARFRELGFPVWMDDFGSGYSSLDVLQSIRFDLIKFDMRFMQQLDSSDAGKIILTELVKMVIGLGVETVCEGVETREQVEFLREIGCTKIQGFYYCKPLPQSAVLKRYEKGLQIGFENPAESEYYATIGGLNLYDMAVLTDEGDEAFRRYFNTIPMAIIEVRDEQMTYVRCNRSYRDFIRRIFNIEINPGKSEHMSVISAAGSPFAEAVLRCCQDGNRALIDNRTDRNTLVHSFIRRVATNPVTGAVAIAIAVLAVIEEKDSEGTTYEHIAKALAADYINLYYVDLRTDEFIEYSSDVSHENLDMERRGEDFFTASRQDAQRFLQKDDAARFIELFTKENILRAMDENGNFMFTYRLMINGTPTYASMKAMRMRADSSHIIIGVSNVDAQMRQKEALMQAQAEQQTYARLSALSGDFICIYVVNPRTDEFIEYSATRDYEGLGLSKRGNDFFEDAKRMSARTIFEEDLERFRSMFSKENLLREIRENGVFELRYRLMIDGAPNYVSLRAAMVREQDEPKLIVGITNVDAQVRREQDYERKLSAARNRVNLDGLTGVKNRTAYDNMADTLTRQIEEGQPVKYAIALCQIVGLEQANERRGREAGNQLIRSACARICDIFKHSPVFRVGGGDFAVIAQGHDYDHIEELAQAVGRLGENDGLERGASIACGMARYTGTEDVASVFARAAALCRKGE